MIPFTSRTRRDDITRCSRPELAPAEAKACASTACEIVRAARSGLAKVACATRRVRVSDSDFKRASSIVFAHLSLTRVCA